VRWVADNTVKRSGELEVNGWREAIRFLNTIMYFVVLRIKPPEKANLRTP
jgi:hypothetical protein